MYDVYIGNMLLPIAPEKITTKINGRNETVNLIDDGEISILKSAGLTTVNFNVLFPNFQYPFAHYPKGFQRPKYYLEKLETLKSKKKPIQFIITRNIPSGGRQTYKPFNTNLTVSIEDYQIIDDAKNGFDIEVQIFLKQFKDYGTKTFTVETPSATAPVVVEATRIESTSSGDGKKSGGKSSGGKSGGKSKTYKVMIPGMSCLTTTATSVQAAITKVIGSSWTGNVEVDGKTYYVSKGKITTKPAKKTTVPATVKKSVEKVTGAITTGIKTAVSAISTVVKTLTSTVRKPTTVTKPVVKPQAKTLMMKQ